LKQQAENAALTKYLTNSTAYDTRIDSEADEVAAESNATHLAALLGTVRKEMHKFAAPWFVAKMMAGKEDTGMNNVPMTLELSAKHHIITTLHTIKETNETVARIAVEQLFDNAGIAAGTLDDPRTLLTRLNKVLEMFIYQGAGFDYARNEYITRPEPEPAVEATPGSPAEETKIPEQSTSKAAEKPESTAKFEEKPETSAKFEEKKFEEVKK